MWRYPDSARQAQGASPQAQEQLSCNDPKAQKKEQTFSFYRISYAHFGTGWVTVEVSHPLRSCKHCCCILQISAEQVQDHKREISRNLWESHTASPWPKSFTLVRWILKISDLKRFSCVGEGALGLTLVPPGPCTGGKSNTSLQRGSWQLSAVFVLPYLRVFLFKTAEKTQTAIKNIRHGLS